MHQTRRQFLRAAAAFTTVAPPLSRIARAQAYPSRPVRIIVGSAAGGAADILARFAGQWLSDRLGFQQFIVENCTGAGTNLATEMAINATPDGHTLLLFTPSSITSAIIQDKIDYIHAGAPIAGVTRQPQIMLLYPSVPARTICSSSPMPKRTQARSTWRRPVPEPCRTWPASCLR